MPVEHQSPVSDISGQYAKGCVGNVDHLHDPPGKAESHPEKGKDSPHEETAYNRLDDHNCIEHVTYKTSEERARPFLTD